MTVRLLVENGIDVDTTNHDERTALHLSAAAGMLECVQLLIFLKARAHP